MKDTAIAEQSKTALKARRKRDTKRQSGGERAAIERDLFTQGLYR